MDKYTTYFGQPITDTELNEIFNGLQSSIEQFIQDFGYNGVATGADVVANITPNMSVNVTAPAAVYDQFGNRIILNTTQNVLCSVDEQSQPVTVAASGNMKWLSVFVKFKRLPTDPRVDELHNTVYFRQVASYELHLVQGPEATISSSPARPPLRGDEILLGDIRLIYGQTTVQTADIDLSRQQTIFKIAGTPVSLAGKKLNAAMTDLVTEINAALNGLSGGSLSVPSVPGSPYSMSAGSAAYQLAALLGFINTIAGQITTLQGDIADANTRIDEIPVPESLAGYAKTGVNNYFTVEQNVPKLTATDTGESLHAVGSARVDKSLVVGSGSPGADGTVKASGAITGSSVTATSGGVTAKTDITSDEGNLTLTGGTGVSPIGGNVSTPRGYLTTKGVVLISDGTGTFDDFYYQPKRTRLTYLNLRLGQPNHTAVDAGSWRWNYNPGRWESYLDGADTPLIDIPILLPWGSILTKVEIGWQRQPETDSFRATKFRIMSAIGFPQHDNDSDPDNGIANVGITGDGGSSDRWRNDAIIPSGSGIEIFEDRTYYLQCNTNSNAVVLSGVRLTWKDPGPRNVHS